MLLSLALALAEPVDGPWTKGHYVDLAVSGTTVHAVWIEGDTLWYSDGLGKPEVVAKGVETGDGGQIRPEIVLAGGAPVVLYSKATKLFRATAGPEGTRPTGVVGKSRWASTPVSPSSVKGPFQAAIAAKGDKVVVAGLAWNGKTSAVFVDGAVVYSGGADGVCMCCKPALAARDEGFVLAFRDADGQRRDIRTLTSADGKTWTDQGDATHGGWSPGGCPSDGPTLTDTTLLVSDARDGKRRVYEVDRYGEHPIAAADGHAESLQPRALPDGSLTAWVEATPGHSSLVVRDGPGPATVLTSTSGRMEPGDPVAVALSVWVPWEGDVAHVERWESQAPPFR